MRTRPAARGERLLRPPGHRSPTGSPPSSPRPSERRRYIATFYTSRFWAHPGAFTVARRPGPVGASRRRLPHRAVRRRGQAAGQLRRLRERVLRGRARSEPPMLGRNPTTPTLILFGPSDHVLYPDFDRMAAVVFPNHVGPFLLARLRPLRAVGGTRTAGLRTRLVLRRSACVKGLIRATGGRTIGVLPANGEIRSRRSHGRLSMPSSTPEAEDGPPD